MAVAMGALLLDAALIGAAIGAAAGALSAPRGISPAKSFAAALVLDLAAIAARDPLAGLEAGEVLAAIVIAPLALFVPPAAGFLAARRLFAPPRSGPPH
jgi:hypothetical protein